MILVADSSALIALSISDGLQLLEPLYGNVLVPQAVYTEVTGCEKPESHRLQNFLKDRIRTVDTANYVYLDAYADQGETEAMLLYKQLKANKLLIDDRRGRRIAQLNGISIIGSLGVLLAAKKQGLLNRVAPALTKLTQSRIYMDPDLLQTVLELAGEKSA